MEELNGYRVKHLEFIENIINRQAHNSFAIKGWSLTLSAGIFTFLLSQEASTNIQGAVYFIVALPAAVFWLLDGYFLRQERIFRCLYDDVRKDIIRQAGEKHAVELFDMKVAHYKRNGQSYLNAICSKTVFGIPLLIVFTSIILFLFKRLT